MSPVRRSKQNLRDEVRYLRQRLRSTDCVLAAIVRTDLCNEVLSRLRGGQPVEDIAEWLNQNSWSDRVALPTFAQYTYSYNGTEANFISAADNSEVGQRNLTTLSPGFDGVSLVSQQPGLQYHIRQRSPQDDTAESQSVLTTSGFLDPMSWAADMDGSLQCRVGCWMESLCTDQLSENMSNWPEFE